MEKTLSDTEISQYIPNIYLYDELKNLSPEDVVNHLPMAILYQEEPQYGHWTLLHQTPEGLEFFDPYGIISDGEFEHLDWQQPHYLSKLLYDLANEYQLNYNQYKFQKANDGINTCGRWIILRSLTSKWTLDEFADVICDLCYETGLTPDELVVSMFTE
jgi:hypothetical protein